MIILKNLSRLIPSIKRIPLAVACMLSMSFACFQANAEDILIVLSSQAGPYVQAANACESKLKSSGISTKQVDLASLNAAQIQQIEGSVIAVGGRASAKLAHDLPATTNLYYCMAPKPKKIGLVDRPNTSGISTEPAYADQVSIIKQGLTSIQRVGVLYRSSVPNSVATLKELQQAVPASWEIIAVDLDAKNSASAGIKDLLKKKLDLVWTVPDTAVYNSSTIKALLLESLRKKIPVFGFSTALVRAGAAFGIGIDPAQQGTQVAEMLLAKVHGAHKQATTSIAVNQIVSERINLSFPRSFVNDADVVYRPE